jgi:hypothetical protein
MRTSPEAFARAALLAHQEAAGMVFDDPDAVVEAPLGSKDEEIPGEWMGSQLLSRCAGIVTAIKGHA